MATTKDESAALAATATEYVTCSCRNSLTRGLFQKNAFTPANKWQRRALCIFPKDPYSVEKPAEIQTI
jgi:hypothetical protein